MLYLHGDFTGIREYLNAMKLGIELSAFYRGRKNIYE